MKITNELLDRADELQEEMFDVIRQIENKHPFTKCSHDDLVHVFVLLKFAELEQQLKQVKK